MPKFEAPRWDRGLLRRIDLVGCFLSIFWAIPLVFALQEGGSAFPWASGAIIGPFPSGLIALAVFLGWERWLGKKTTDTILPLRLFKNPAGALVFLYVSFD
jgi:hypothetical protein